MNSSFPRFQTTIQCVHLLAECIGALVARGRVGGCLVTILRSSLPASALSPDASLPDLRERLAARLHIVVPALRQRLGDGWSAAETDLVLAHYLYGLVDNVSRTASAVDQLALMRDLGSTILDPDALDCALFTAPPSMSATDTKRVHLARTLAAAESLGRRDAEAVLVLPPADPDRTLAPAHLSTSSCTPLVRPA